MGDRFMNKINFKNLVLLGLASGFAISGQKGETTENFFVKDQFQGFLAHKCGGSSASSTPGSDDSADVNNNGNLNYHLMTEDELLIELSAEGKKQYDSLSPEGKALARYVASQRCMSTNKCKGLNACATDKNDCAGKGECKGKGKCAVADKNLAVKLVSDKMAQKRENANK